MLCPLEIPTNYKRPRKVECLRQYILNILADASLYILSTPDVVRMSNIVTQIIFIITLIKADGDAVTKYP
jgi:hypothetical protein